jgi:ABC-2 type transport system permease protein/lipopolysaccharide transport system permease protein
MMGRVGPPPNDTTRLEPPADLRFRRRLGLTGALRELIGARHLVAILTERQFRIRYKQASLGVAWALLTPALYLAVFTLVFQRATHIDTGGADYAVYAYLGLVPWTFFSTAVSNGALSLVGNVPLLNKVYCPREVFPLSAVGAAIIDTVIASGLLVVLLIVRGVVPEATSWWAIPLLAVALAHTSAVVLFVAVLTVYFRDVRHLLPVLLQVGLFATPVAYGLDEIPSDWRPLYVAANPLGIVIDGLRRSVLGGTAPDLQLLAIGSVTAGGGLALAYFLFKRFELGIADVA